jgi:hypothetical protein
VQSIEQGHVLQVIPAHGDIHGAFGSDVFEALVGTKFEEQGDGVGLSLPDGVMENRVAR